MTLASSRRAACSLFSQLLSRQSTLLTCSARSVSVLRPPGTPETPERTVAEVVRNLTETVIGGPTSYDPEKFKLQRESMMDLVPKSQDELPPRRMIDSFDQVSPRAKYLC